MSTLAVVLSFILWLLMMLLLGRFVYDLILAFAPDWRPGAILATLGNVIFAVTDPPLRAIRNVLPPLRIGNIGIDLGMVILFLLIGFLQRLTLLYL
ncbi:YggT family protein [Actinomycetaceae bacterium TAE3-ERU4]|nr:YggT family protein [Actinomycetaceae bacterium TAE3-ERU4]